MKSVWIWTVVVILVIASFSGGYIISSYGKQGSSQVQQENVTKYVTVIDDENNIVYVKQPVNRIVSLAPSCTELAFALGLGNKIVGDTIYDTFPPAAQNITKIGGVTNVSVEEVVSLKPDLVLAYDNFAPQAVQQLKSLGIPVIIFNPPTMLSIEHDLMILGLATNTTSNATKVINLITKTVNSIENVTYSIQNRTTVFYLGWYNPIWTAGQGTFINDLITLAGGINVASSGYSWYTIDKETLVKENPQYILVSQYQSYLISTIENDSTLSNITAIKEKHFIVLPDIYLQQPGPQMFVGLVLLFQKLYPQYASSITPLTLNEIFPGT